MWWPHEHCHRCSGTRSNAGSVESPDLGDGPRALCSRADKHVICHTEVEMSSGER